jgi:hypothetical protein
MLHNMDSEKSMMAAGGHLGFWSENWAILEMTAF